MPPARPPFARLRFPFALPGRALALPRCARHFALAALALLVAAPALLAADGDFDPAFDGDGFHLYADPVTFSNTSALVGPDGAEVVFGEVPVTGAPALHWRRLDVGGNSPICQFVLSGVSSLRPAGATFDSAGRLLLLAGVRVAPGAEESLGVVRFLYPDCDPDESLDGDGLVLHAPALAGHSARTAGDVSTARWTTIPPLFQQRILVAFSARAPSGDPATFLLRLLPDGALDTGFGGGDGIEPLLTDFLVTALRRTGDQHFLLVGLTDTADFDFDTVLFQVDRDGAADVGFGFLGYARLDLSPALSSGDALSALALGADGRIWLAGRTDLGSGTEYVAAVAVLTRAGELDPAFSGDGWTTFAISGSEGARFRSVAPQGDGKVLAAGLFTDPAAPGDDEGLVARFTRAGTLDSTFGAGGVRTFAFDGSPLGEDQATAVSLRPDGRVWLVGSTAVDAGGNLTHYRPWIALLRNALIFADGFESGGSAAW